ncbi:DNA polymerase domain-containing protein [Halosimplex halobium]|uniref:DNA polymerase domain-containing protein n=1 Tax=Halosimplex halobium TaxID=3396618 RepID=UPI003F564FAB
MGQVRDDFEHYEADILFPNRLLIDKDIESGVRVPERRDDDGTIRIPHQEVEAVDDNATPRVNTFDIEVDDRNGFPEDGEQTIVCLTSHDSYDDEYINWLYQSPAGVDGPAALAEYEPIEDDIDADVRVFDSEPEMLDAYVEYLEEETDPDLITGWNCLPGDSAVQMADGTLTEIREVEAGDEVVGSEAQQTTVAEVTNKWESEKEVLRFDLADGTELSTSGDHRVMVGDEDQVGWKRGESIECGDYVLKPRKLRVDDTSVPALSDLVPTANQRFASEERVKEIKSELPEGAVTELADTFDLSKGTLYHPKTDVWTLERCEVAAEEYGIAVPDGGREYRRTRADLDRELTARELYLAGLVLTDGSMSRDDGVRFYNTREELHEQFTSDPHLEPDGKGCYKQNVLDYATMYAFNGLGIPFGDKNDGSVDLSMVYELPEEYIAKFLAGVIDGDGNVSSCVTVAAENRSIGDWYVKLFKRLGIYAEQRDHIVRIPSAKRDMGRLKRRVLPHMNHGEKVDALEDFAGGKSGRSENIPYALFDAETGSDEKRIGRDKHRRDINLKRHETKSEEWEEFVFVEVDDIEVTGTETTYDIETTTHNFVADECLVHNCDDFDAPYLLDRMEELQGPDHDYDLDIDRLSRVDEVWRSDWNGPDIKGRVVFDLLRAYKSTQFTELESYRLDAVGEMELDAGKERYTGDIGDLWEDDPERLLEYNLRDVELCVELDRKQDIIAFWDEARKLVGCKIEDAPTAGDAVDMYVLHKAYGEFALPSKGQQDATDEFEGGAVFDPITGVRENVSVLDLKSLYPMSMTTINASPETKVDPESYDGETYRTPTGVHFRKEPDGIIREMVDELLSEREEKKSLRNDNDPGSEAYERYDRQQAAVKVIMNSLYGVFGWDRFRLYDREMSAGVTSTNRKVISFTAEASSELGYDVTYGDSVTGDRPVVVRDASGTVRIVPIADLFERATERTDSSIVVTADGGVVPATNDPKDRRTLEGWEALSLSDEGEPEWQPIEQVIRHRTEKDVVKLQHKFGESVTTRDHAYVVEHGDGYGEASPADVEAPVRVPDVPAVDERSTVDVYEVLDGYTREYEDGRGGGGEDVVTKVKRVYADDQWVWFGHEHHRDQSKTVRVKRHIDLAGEDGRALVRLLAAYISEGSSSTIETTDSRFGASISEERAAWLEPLQDDYHRLFDNTNSSIVACDSGGERTVEYEIEDGSGTATYDDRTQKLQMMNELVAVFFREFAGQTSRGKRIPSFVFHLPEELQDLFLETLVEGDGSREFPRYSDEYAEQNFDFETTSRELAGGLSMLLTQRGRKHSLKYRDEKDSYTIRTCTYYRRGRDPQISEAEHDGHVYDLSVAENGNFVDAVGGVVLHNTDSVMLELGDLDTEGAIEKSFEIEEHINDRYDEFAREELNADSHRFQIEFEKLYRRFFQAGKKKRYAGHIVWKEGKEVDDIDITGFEYQRSDIAPITKEVQLQVIEMIVHGEDIEDVKDYVHGVIEDYQNGEVSLDDVGIPGGIGKKLDNYDTDTAQVRGAKYANLLLDTNFASGSKPKRVYLEKVHPEFFREVEEEMDLDPAEDPLYGEFKRDPDVICFEYADQVPDAFEVDWDKMLDKTLKGPIARILEALDVSWEEVKSGQEQTGLESFM